MNDHKMMIFSDSSELSTQSTELESDSQSSNSFSFSCDGYISNHISTSCQNDILHPSINHDTITQKSKDENNSFDNIAIKRVSFQSQVLGLAFSKVETYLLILSFFLKIILD